MRLNGQKIVNANPHNILQVDEFLLITIINTILLTVELTIFNICFLLMFITSGLKFYKSYVMEKHVDLIEIPPISTQPKTSIFVHLFSRVVHDILTNKSLTVNLMYIGFVIVGYFLLRQVPMYVLLIIIVDGEYLYWLWKRFKISQHHGNNNIHSQIQSKPNNSSTQPSNINPKSSLLQFLSSPKTLRSAITDPGSGFNGDMSQFSQSPKSPSHLEMRMIEQVEQDKVLEDDLPQFSTIKVITSSSSINLR